MVQPTLKAFLPFFYLVWSDDLLTPHEFSTLKAFIGTQNWLSQQDKDILYANIDITRPPSRQQLMAWKADIQKSRGAGPGPKSLFDLALVLSDNNSTISNLKPLFTQLENDLGISGGEAIHHFALPVAAFPAKQQLSGSFDTAKMTQLLDGTQAAIINKVRSLISRPEFTYDNATDIAAYREKVYDWCKILAAEGLGNMAYPEQYGGGGDLSAYFAIMETLSYHDLSLVIKFGVQFGLWGMSVLSLGTEKHYTKYLAAIGSLQLPGCFAMTETHHGSNVKGLETTATYHHPTQTFTIHTPDENAQKEYIGNAACHGRMATVFARLIIEDKDYGINAFVVPLRDSNGIPLEGITIGDCGPKMGLNGVDNGTIRFDHIIIPKENMLDRFASVNDEGAFESPIPSDNRRFFTMLGTLVGGRIGVPRSALSAAKSGLAIAIRYSDQRRQFGPEGGSEVPVLDYRMHQRRLMPLLAATYAMHFGLQYLTSRFLNKQDDEMQEIEALAAGMKACVTWHVRDILQECREACGGKGYLSENRIGALKNDTEVYTTFEGDNTVLMQLTAKNRLSVFRKSFGEMNAAGMISYVFEQARTIVTEKNPVATRRTDTAHLLDGEFHLQAFEHREKAILAAAAKRIKKLTDNGLDAYDAFNVVQHQLTAVARAYIERVTLEAFQKAIVTVTDEPCRQALTRLSQLYALSLIETHKSWYLEDGYMEAVKTKAIRKAVDQLCLDIRPDAIPLVNAFGIPDSCLAAPIAFL